MSYSSARSLAQSAKVSTNDEASRKLADAVHALSRAAEHDIDKLDRDIKHLEAQVG
jgi:hypothetical protein